MPLRVWKRIETRTLAVNSHWSYCLDRFTIDDTLPGEYHYVHTRGSTMVIPVTSDGKLLLVRQYRYLNNKAGLEFPAGGIQDSVTPLENARKELREECGYDAAELKKIGEFTPFTGAADEVCHLFTARRLTPAPLPPDATEDFEILSFTPQELDTAAATNEIWDGLTLAAWMLARKEFLP